VVIIDRENGIDTVKDRMFRLGISDKTCDLRVWGTWGDCQERQPPGPASEVIIRYARKHRPLLMWDSLVSFAGCDENDASAMRAHMNHYRRLASLGASTVILHHSSEKSESARNYYRGSTDIPASVDSAWNLARASDECAGDPL